MDPAPDVRDIIEAEHKKAQHPARPWLVSDQTAAVIATPITGRPYSPRSNATRFAFVYAAAAMAMAAAIPVAMTRPWP